MWGSIVGGISVSDRFSNRIELKSNRNALFDQSHSDRQYIRSLAGDEIDFLRFWFDVVIQPKQVFRIVVGLHLD